jgi:hypothetical protein
MLECSPHDRQRALRGQPAGEVTKLCLDHCRHGIDVEEHIRRDEPEALGHARLPHTRYGLDEFDTERVIWIVAASSTGAPRGGVLMALDPGPGRSLEHSAQ